MTELRQFTVKELEENNGKNGKPAYAVYQGKVYDLSQSRLWIGGEHMSMHQTGKDIKEELELAPHGEEILEKVKLIGAILIYLKNSCFQKQVHPTRLTYLFSVLL